MANIEGLVERKTGKNSRTWYYRLSVPKAERTRAHCNDIWISLRTSVKSKAIDALPDAMKRARATLAQKLQATSASGQGLPTKVVDADHDAALAHRLAEAHYVAIREKDSLERARLYERAAADEVAFYKGKLVCLPDTPYMKLLSEDPETPLATALSYYWLHRHEKRVALLKRSVSAGDFAEGAQLLASLPSAENLTCEQPGDQVTFARTMMQAEIRALTDINKQDDWRPAYTNADRGRPSKLIENGQQLPLFSLAAGKWVEEKSRGGWSKRRKDACEATVRLFIEILRDRPIGSYRKIDVLDFKEVLCDLPPNWRKLKETRSLGARNAAKKARMLSLPRMSITNVNKLITIVAGVFDWSASHYDGFDNNAFKNATIANRALPRDQRDPFSLADLKVIFSAPVFVGCGGEARWKASGTIVLRHSPKFWLPLLGLYTGARLNELCKLKTTDVRYADGVHYLDINAEPHSDGVDSAVKSNASKRQIPIHDDLIKFGFLEFHKMRSEQKSERLFPELSMDRYGKLADHFGKHFARFLISCGIKRPKIDFHSFRHTWTDACRNSRLTHEEIYALKGEALKGTLSRYGHGKTDLEILGLM